MLGPAKSVALFGSFLALFAAFCSISSAATDVNGQAAANPAIGEIPTEIFASDGDVFQPKLSPDGSQLVYRQNIEGKTYLSTLSFDQGSSFRKAMPEGTELKWYRWAGNTQILFSVTSIKRYSGLRANFVDNEFRQVEMYLLDTGSRRTRYIGPEKVGPDGDNILYLDPDGRFLVMKARESVYKYPAVFRIELATNKSEKIVDEQSKIWDWVTDNAGVVRLGLSYRRNSTIIYYRQSAADKFKRIDKVKTKDVLEKGVEALLDGFVIVAGTNEGYVLSNERTGRFALHRFNLLTREVGELVFAHDTQDVDHFVMDDDGAALKAVRYTDSRDRIVWFDEYFSKQQRMLERALPGQEVWIVSHSRDKEKMVIFSTSPQDPGSYYLYEPKVRKMERFAGINDRIDPALMAETSYESYAASDGTLIPAYVTIPRGRKQQNLPLIILPHGGPFGVRDTLDYNLEVQFLANRGYVVLQPNFRGSGSYGEGFYKLGEGEIGRSMQDDLDDGMDWLVKRGLVDPKRVCIVGSSYGGYAALWGVTRNPDRYRCAASFAGVTDWDKQLKYDRQFLRSRYYRDWREAIEGEDDFDLDDVSPVHNADKLKRPVLLVHGKKDSNVPYSQFEIYRDKLQDRELDIVFVTYEDEGHGLADKNNRKDWLDRLEKFLDTHNPA